MIAPPEASSTAAKRVLVVYYTQSGQTRRILERLLEPLAASSQVSLDWEELRPEKPFPFPWSLARFFDAFPESARCLPAPLLPPTFDASSAYDLVVIGYQPWFLSPSVPVSSFLQASEGRAAIGGRPVVTVIGCRNMWLSGQEKLKRLLAAAGGRLVGNIVMGDRSPNLVSALTILHWMLTGKRDRVWGILPEPGVNRADIEASDRFGRIIRGHLESGTWEGLQDELRRQGAVEIIPSLMTLETRGSRMFDLWAGFILKKGGPGDAARRRRVTLFRVYLPAVLFLASPLVSLVMAIVSSLRKGRVAAEVDYYSGVTSRVLCQGERGT